MKINITKKAQEELKKILDKRKEASKSVRIYLAGFG
jgi:Fe-S cluster assembly iron-binding protein IscA